MSAVAIAPYVIRWGPDGWRDMLRQTACGKHHATSAHVRCYVGFRGAGGEHFGSCDGFRTVRRETGKE